MNTFYRSKLNYKGNKGRCILYISLYFLYNVNISGIGWLVGGSFMSETFLAINVTVIQLSLNVLLVMDCVTARCGSQVQPTKMTLARQ